MTLDESIRRAARAPALLVGCDYDGTLSPIAARPDEARPHPRAIPVLRALAQLPHTSVAVISGRALRDLAAQVESPAGVTLIGSHGCEFDQDFAQKLPNDAVALLAEVTARVREISARCEGTMVEEKAAAAALHFRGATPAQAAAAVEAALSGPARLPGVSIRHGNMVVELAVVHADKGAAFRTLRQRLGTCTAVFLGDDPTDEDAFAALGQGDLGIKVGPGESLAGFRVPGVDEVIGILEKLVAMRSRWLSGEDEVPIQHHSLLSDQRTIALVTPEARITWLCLPRIDSPALFAELLGGPDAGYFSIAPATPAGPPRQAYLGDSFILETRWPDITVTDYLDCSSGRAFQRSGRTDLLRVVEGTGRAVVRFAPRPDFGRVMPRLSISPDGLEILDTPDPVVLHAPGVAWTIADHVGRPTAVAEVDLVPGQSLILELRYGTATLKPAVAAEPRRRAMTDRFWTGWAGSLRLPALHPELVRRSALVLKALCHGPTGAIAAAGTMGLPEVIGGVRNWDYRYCWPRDAALAATSLVRLGSTGQAMRLLDWLLAVVDSCESPDRLRPLYTVLGTELGPEADIGELGGYAGSRPVRVGNAAAQQVQLDVFGPIVDLISSMGDGGVPLTPDHWRLVQRMVWAVEQRWQEPDNGIWEIRGPRRHHTHTKGMCWLTLDRAAHIADVHIGRPRREWVELRDQIREDVLRNGLNPETGGLTASYGSPDADAATLLIGLIGLLDPNGREFRSTVAHVEGLLLDRGVVRRYRYEDGLPGTEGGFHICTSWLIQAYSRMGRIEEARSLLASLAGWAGQTGLLPEELDPATGRALGNHPQAYSHIGLIDAACCLSAV